MKKLKICILGNTSNPVTGKKEDPYSWFVLSHLDGFVKNGHEVLLIDYKTNNINSIRFKIEMFAPQYVFTHLTFHNNIHRVDNMLSLFETLHNKYGIKFIHTCGDARTEDRYMRNLSPAFYAAFVGTYGMVENGTRAWNIPVFYSPYSCLTYNNIAEPINELKIKKPIFTGSPNAHKDRSAFIKLLQEYGCIKIYHTQSGNDLRSKTPELSSSASAILGLCTGYQIEGFVDVRPFQYMGTGACFIARKFKNMDNLIPPDLYYPFEGYTRKDAQYIKKLSLQILKEDTWPMRCKAFRFMQQNHSSKVRMKNVLDVLDGKREEVL